MAEKPMALNENYSDDEIDLGEIFSTIMFRKRLLLSVALLVFITAALTIFQLEKKYTASSKIMIGLPKTNVIDVESVLSGGMTGDMEIRGEQEVLRSRGLAERVVDKFKLEKFEEFNASLRPPGLLSYFSLKNLIPEEYHAVLGMVKKPLSPEQIEVRIRTSVVDVFIKKLKISSIKRSNVVEIAFESKNPVLAAKIANEIPEAYIIGQMEAKFMATERATKWLDEQLIELKVKLEASENAVQIYKIEHGISEGAKDSLIQEQMSAINIQLAQVKAEKAEFQAKYTQIKRMISGDDFGLESSSEVLKSPLIQRIREQEVQVLRKRSELSVEFGKKHPKMIQVTNELEDLRLKITSEVHKIASALKNDVQVAYSRQSSLQNSLSQLEKESGVSQTARIKLRTLEREASSNKALFTTFLDRFKETSSTLNIQQADARVISRAVEPIESSFPKTRLLLIVSGALSIFCGLVVVFIVEGLSNGVFTPEQAESEFGLPVIGVIPVMKTTSPHEYIRSKPHSSYSEAFNTLKTSIMLSDPDNPIKVIAVTSALPEEGKSTLVLSLASSLAQSVKRVLIVDTDIRRAVIDKKLGLQNTKGLTDFLLDDVNSLSDYITKHEETGVYLMPKGKGEYVNATDLLSSHRMEKAVKALRLNFDFIIFDTPPVMAVTDARVVAGLVDKMIFVVRWSETPKKVVAVALDQLRKVNADIAGIVLQQTDIQKQKSRYYGAKYSGYYYHYGKYGNYYSS